MKNIEKKVRVKITYKKTSFVSTTWKNFMLHDEETITNLKFNSAEGAIDWLFSQPWQQDILYITLTEDVYCDGWFTDIISLCTIWKHTSRSFALWELQESRKMNIKEMFDISL